MEKPFIAKNGLVTESNNLIVGTALTVNTSGIYRGATLIANSSGPFGKSEGSLNVNSALVAVSAVSATSTTTALFANNSSFLNSKSEGSLNVNNAVTAITSNNSSFLNSKSEGSLNVNSATSALSANNASYLGGIIATSYQLNSTLSANIASYLPTYNGIVNAASLTITNLTANSSGLYANQVNANKVYNSNNGSRLPTLLTTISVSNAASISTSDVFSTFGADYSDFMITFYRLVPTVNDKHIYLRWYANGVYQNTNYTTYGAVYNGVGAAGLTPTNQYWVGHRANNTSNRGYTGNINIFNAKDTSAYKHWYHDSAGLDVSSGINRMWGGGDLNISNPITGFQIYAESGNLSGVVKIYGLS